MASNSRFPLSWSFSAQQRFKDCKRKHFHHRFWDNSPALKWNVYTMKGLTSIPMLKGSAIHHAISEGIGKEFGGWSFSAGDARDILKPYIQNAYTSSMKRWYDIRNRPQGMSPKSIKTLFEHYYSAHDDKTIEGMAVKALRDSKETVAAVLDSDTWQEIKSAKILERDEEGNFPYVELEGIRVYMKVDLAYENGQKTILDWKTGEPKDIDAEQLALYALYAQDKWGWLPEETALKVVYANPSGVDVRTCQATNSDLENLKASICQSHKEMLSLEPALDEPADIELFPMSKNGRCGWCNFKGMCEMAEAKPEGDPDPFDW